MAKTLSLNPAEVVKKGNKWVFKKQGEEIASLGIITFPFKEKLLKELKRMKYFLPTEDFIRSQIQIPVDEAGLLDYSNERDALKTWGPAIMYMKAEDKKAVARNMCADFLGVETPDEVFVHKFSEILSEFSEILTNFKQNAEKN